ncbi:CAAX prenyl protease 2 isoform X2 [Zea mays]|uniref:intramembrane prenyl-peptidase Rce1 n=1 Tax=Zea mays TaxID=4577 RepID=A0A1D6M286_MAIZE|nr:CAAX prenyl protease 2 isoform X2 [Zea mays]AQK85341.1 CAAX prenyl protease 2 [Zea mays]|eukprot:XP_008647358.1 CAAX prenyl protease 2 isoform X2 [Zea mays]
MATPAGLLLASPPVISGVAAMAACAAMAVFYVAVLYAPTVILRFPPPTSLRTFLHRRFACAAVASAASVLATASLLRVWSLSDFADMFAVFGIRKDHLIQAVAIPLLLTSLVYAGSFVARVWLLVSSWGGGDEVEIGCAQRLAQWIQAAVADVMVWRNYVVAPFTEELVFRACMIPLLLCGGFKMSTIIFLSPIFFSLGVQLGYTVIFGWYATFLLIRTGNLLCPIIAHVFCNMMGLPVFSSPRTKGAALVAFLAGSIAFFWLLFPATSPELYNSSFDRCSCWHGFCNWK